MERVFNKLVRDNIPKKIESNGEVAVTRTLDDEEYEQLLYLKLIEETQEVISSRKTEDVMEELADVLEIIKTIAEVNDKTLEDIIEIANQKRFERGGFKNKVFLERTYNK